MFFIDQKPNCTWSHTSFGRGKRTAETGVGAYVIEHVATGKCLVLHAKNVSQDVDANIQMLMGGRHPNRLMNIQVNMDMDLKLHEYPAPSIANAKDMARKIKASIDPKYLLLNP